MSEGENGAQLGLSASDTRRRGCRLCSAPTPILYPPAADSCAHSEDMRAMCTHMGHTYGGRGSIRLGNAMAGGTR